MQPSDSSSRFATGTPVLEGVRVLDLTQQLSGPYATMILGDLGADVIKIEAPQRPDPARGVPGEQVGGQSSYYLSLNRNKRSVTLDLKEEDDRQVFYRLVQNADVVLDNFRPGVTARLRVDHETLLEHNPQIVTCSLTGFGENGPEKDRPGYDYLMQALAGTMDLTGEPDGPPTKYGISVVDHVGGLFAVIGVLAALTGQTRTGSPGRHIDLSLFDTHLSLLSYVAGDLLNGGALPQRQPLSAHPRLVPSQVFATADGWIVLMPLAEHFWPRLCSALGAEQLARDPRFNNAAARLANRQELLQLLEAQLITGSTADWMSRMLEADVPAAPVQSVADALAMPQVQARDMVVEVTHPKYGRYSAIGNPVKISGSGPALVKAAPEFGEDNAEILGRAAQPEASSPAAPFSGIAEQ